MANNSFFQTPEQEAVFKEGLKLWKETKAPQQQRVRTAVVNRAIAMFFKEELGLDYPLPAPFPMKDVAKRIRELRKKKFLTQQELADMAGINVATVNALENARLKSADETTLRQIAKALNVKLEAIYPSS